MNSNQTVERVEQIRTTLEDRDSEDLLEIWQKNDRQEWSNETFEAVGKILTARGISLPAQNQPAPVEVEAPEAETVVIEEEGTYSDRQSLFNIASLAKILSWFFIGLFVLILVVNLFAVVQSVLTQGSTVIQALSEILSGVALPLLICGFFWVMLRAIGEGIYLLMDIEENTRQPRREKARNASGMRKYRS